MHWIEVSMEVDGEAAEAVAEVLNRYGHQGVAIEQAGFPMETWEDEIPQADRLIVRAYLPDDDRAPAAKQQLIDAFRYMNRLYPIPAPQFNVIDEQDWAEAWKAHYKPLRVGQHLYIRPIWMEVSDAQPDDVLLALDPGMAFGTGTHPSTQLVLTSTERIITEGVQVLDLGCGSGILAIAAAKLGAGHVWALDNDPVAVKVASENIADNAVTEQVTVLEGSLDELLAGIPGAPRQFDVALVNILAKVIIALMEQGLAQVIRPGGVAVFAGIILEQADDVETALRASGLIPTARHQSSDWVAIEAQRPEA